MPVPETRFARARGADIAYQVFGAGPVDLLWAPGWISHLEVMWDLAEFARFLEHLGRFARVVTFDKRGTGMSDRVEGTASVDERVDDVRAVLDAAGIERAVLVGWFDAAAILAVFAVRHPERVQGLVCGSATVKFGADPGEIWGMDADVIAVAAAAFEGGDWGLGAMLPVIAPSVGDDERLLGWWRRYERTAATPSAAATMLRANQLIDVREVLPEIHVPTLVLHRRDTVPVSAAAARQFADAIPGAAFRLLAGADVFPYLGDQDSVLAEIEEFVTGVRPVGNPDRVLATIVFSDIVGSTDLARQQGDARWRGTLAAHDGLAERLAVRHGGRIVDTTGDGALAALEGPTQGLDYARELVEAVHALGLCVRAGVHTCEVERRGTDLAGIGVHIGARVGALARGDEVLVTSTVRELVIGSPAHFTDAGEHRLKGIDGTWHLYALELGGNPSHPARDD